MDITIKKREQTSHFSDLYNFLKKNPQQANFFNQIALYDFESVLINGITYEAYIGSELAGFVNFEILEDADNRYSVHNLIAASTGHHRKLVLQQLFDAEADFLRHVGDIHIITSRVYESNTTQIKEMEANGFVKNRIWKRNFKHINFICVELNKCIDGTIHLSTNRLNYLKSQVITHLRFKDNGDFSNLYKLSFKLLYALPIRKALKNQKELLESIHQRQKAKVMFVASSFAMWKYQSIYDLLIKDPRFEVFILLSPFPDYSHDQQATELAKMRAGFDAKGMKYIDYQVGGPIFDAKKEINPDVIFYTQTGSDWLTPLHAFENFKDRLLTYYPYGYYIENNEIYYNSFFQNIAWKLFYSNPFQLQHAKDMAINKGINVAVVGNPTADEFAACTPVSPWKDCGDRKRIIWAPHFSINSNTSYTNHSNFMWMADFMLELAQRYADKIQIAFKPHPRLKTELYKNQIWGKEKTDKYYAQWSQLPNCQLEVGDFIDLFLTSDAMIHDSTSFCVDYLYADKPVMYVSHDIDSYKTELDKMGHMVLDMHYIGTSLKDIQEFVDEVILGGNDTKKEERHDFVKQYLLPPNGKSTAQNTFDEMVNSLFL